MTYKKREGKKSETNKYLKNENIPILQEGDIVLLHTKKNFFRHLIRKVTNSYWDHSTMVIFPKDKKRGNFYNLIIEAVAPRGIEIHKLDKYLADPDTYEIGIKRIPNLNQETRDRVISFMLMNVDAPYYKLKFSKFLFASISKKYTEKLLGHQRYSCSGLVQKAFYEAANWDQRQDLIFREDFLSPIELQEITTPGDIARSKKAKWIFNEK